MKNITTTQLRTRSKQLVMALRDGEVVELIHRSTVIGKIQPIEPVRKVFNAKRMKKIVEDLNLPYIARDKREKLYRKHLEEKYGKGIS